MWDKEWYLLIAVNDRVYKQVTFLRYYGIPAKMHRLQEKQGPDYLLQAEACLRGMRDEGHKR